MASLGMHCLLELYRCPAELLDDATHVERVLRRAAERAEATWLGKVSHRFEPHGVTALGLLAESHIAVHTWPERGYAAADVFTCGERAMPERACRHLAEGLRAGHHEIRRVDRGDAEALDRPGAAGERPHRAPEERAAWPAQG